MPPILIIGLGNPGEKYDKTRHNAGFMAIDALANSLETHFKMDTERHAAVAETVIGENKIILAKPQTFMNQSGLAVRLLADRYKVASPNIWIISDDVSLEIGTLRVRSAGTAGGHNGLKSIIEHLDTELFPRFKIGVGTQPSNVPLDTWVLTKFSNDEMLTLNKVIEQTEKTIIDSIKQGLDIHTEAIE